MSLLASVKAWVSFSFFPGELHCQQKHFNNAQSEETWHDLLIRLPICNPRMNRDFLFVVSWKSWKRRKQCLFLLAMFSLMLSNKVCLMVLSTVGASKYEIQYFWHCSPPKRNSGTLLLSYSELTSYLTSLSMNAPPRPILPTNHIRTRLSSFCTKLCRLRPVQALTDSYSKSMHSILSVTKTRGNNQLSL